MTEYTVQIKYTIMCSYTEMASKLAQHKLLLNAPSSPGVASDRQLS